jgi:FMN phosphatase YigB (HAD superfamily)
MSYLITLDLWGTIIGEKDYSSVSPKRSIKKCELIFDYIKEFSDTITLNDVIEALDFTVNKISLYSRFFCDQLFFDWLLVFIRRLDHNLNKKLTKLQIIYIGELIDRAFLEFPPLIFNGSLKLIEFCKKNQIKIGIISNTGFNSPKVYKNWLINEKIFYDEIVLSNELGIAKPDKKIFYYTLDKLGISPGNSIHFGDNPVADIMGANSIGISSVLISKNNSKNSIDSKNFMTIDNISESVEVMKKWLDLF